MAAVFSPLSSPVCASCSLQRVVLEQAALIESLQGRIAELETRLARYENPHVPSSRLEKPSRPSKSNGKRGRPAGCEGSTRPVPVPTRIVPVTLDVCPRCRSPLGEPVRIESRVVEEIPEPRPVLVTEFKVAHYECSGCGEHVVARHPELPRVGRFGPRALAHVALLKYDSRLPHEKVVEVLGREHGLWITTATVLDITRRVSDALKDEYEAIKKRIRAARVVYVDETGMRVNGANHWVWVFTTEHETLVVIRHSRGKKVLKEVLGKKYDGIIVCDGHKSYSNYTSRLQRCWAHLLREAKDLAEKIPEGVPLNKALHRLYKKLTDALKDGPPPDERKRLLVNAQQTLSRWAERHYQDERLEKFAGKIRNGLRHFLTFIVEPGVEPTNNRAERALREHVVIRKIIGTLRNTKGTTIHETIMTCLATWKQQELNPNEEIIKRMS